MTPSALPTAGNTPAQPTAAYTGLLRTLRRGLERSACIVLFLALWLTAIRTEVRRRRVMTLRARLAQEA